MAMGGQDDDDDANDDVLQHFLLPDLYSQNGRSGSQPTFLFLLSPIFLRVQLVKYGRAFLLLRGV